MSVTRDKFVEDPPVKLEQITLLMVEDDSYYFEAVQCLLKEDRRINFVIVHAGSLLNAIDYLRKETPDVILLDLNLPDSAGINTLIHMQGLAERLPIVILTGSNDRDLGLQAIIQGADDFLVKQRADADSLIRCIRYSMLKKAEESRMRVLAIQDFIATLAHDLQIPMIGSKNVLDALIERRLGPLQPKQIKVLRELRDSNNDQLKLVHKLIEIYRYEAGSQSLDFEAINVEELLAHSTTVTSKDSETQDVRIHTRIEPGIEQIYGDSEAIMRSLGGLIDNAIKFSDAGGTVEIDAENLDGYVTIKVTNHGRIISPEEQLNLFTQFWTGIPGKRYVANIGMGLYLSHRIVMLHKGKIACKSSSTEGTTFSITLPTVRSTTSK